MPGPSRALLGACLAAAAALGACGGSDAEPPAPTGTAGRAGTAGATVVMGEFYYRPTPATVRVGDPVTFVNEGAIEHTVADTTPSGAVRSRLIRPRPLATGDRQRVVFRAPGVVRYVCTFHPTEMRGRILVQR